METDTLSPILKKWDKSLLNWSTIWFSYSINPNVLDIAIIQLLVVDKICVRFLSSSVGIFPIFDDFLLIDPWYERGLLVPENTAKLLNDTTFLSYLNPSFHTPFSQILEYELAVPLVNSPLPKCIDIKLPFEEPPTKSTSGSIKTSPNCGVELIIEYVALL